MALAGQRLTTAFVVDVEPQSLPLIYLLGIPESPVTIARLRNTEGGELFVEGFRERHGHGSPHESNCVQGPKMPRLGNI